MKDARATSQRFSIWDKGPLKVISIITLWSFLFTTGGIDTLVGTAWAARTTPELTSVGSVRAGSPGTIIKELNIKTFNLPQYLGHIRDSYDAGVGTPIVIHIQDAHTNYACQHKLSELIEFLNNEYGMKQVNLEGGAGDYDLAIFNAITDKETRMTVSDNFVKDGLVNGAEYFAINNPDKASLWGVEDVKLYLDNLKVYRDSLKFKDTADKYIKDLSSILGVIKNKVYSKELLELDKKFADYKDSTIDLKDYIRILMKYGRSQVIDVKGYTNIYLLQQSLDQEEKIDFKVADIERSKLLDILQKSLPKRQLDELVTATLEFQTEMISQGDYYTYLLKKAKAAEIDISKMPELQKYIIYISLYQAIDKTRILDEMTALETRVKDSIFRNNEERKLDELSRNLALAKNLFNISITRDDYKYYLAHKDRFLANNFKSYIDKEAPKYNIPVKLPKGISELDSYRDKIAEFYVYSFKRDDAFMKNMKLASAASGRGSSSQKSAVMVTGGFHTENLCDLYKKNNISYISIMPNFKSGDSYIAPYFNLLSGKEPAIISELKPIMAQVSSMQIASILSAELGEAVWGEKGVAAFNAAVIIDGILEKNGMVRIVNKDKTFILAKEDGKVIKKEDDEGEEPVTIQWSAIIAEIKANTAPAAAPKEKIVTVQAPAKPSMSDTEGGRGADNLPNDRYYQGIYQAIKDAMIFVLRIGDDNAMSHADFKVDTDINGKPLVGTIEGISTENQKDALKKAGILIPSADNIRAFNELISLMGIQDALKGISIIFIDGQKAHYSVGRGQIYLDINLLRSADKRKLIEELVHELKERSDVLNGLAKNKDLLLEFQQTADPAMRSKALKNEINRLAGLSHHAIKAFTDHVNVSEKLSPSKDLKEEEARMAKYTSLMAEYLKGKKFCVTVSGRIEILELKDVNEILPSAYTTGVIGLPVAVFDGSGRDTTAYRIELTHGITDDSEPEWFELKTINDRVLETVDSPEVRLAKNMNTDDFNKAINLIRDNAKIASFKIVTLTDGKRAILQARANSNLLNELLDLLKIVDENDEKRKALEDEVRKFLKELAETGLYFTTDDMSNLYANIGRMPDGSLKVLDIMNLTIRPTTPDLKAIDAAMQKAKDMAVLFNALNVEKLLKDKDHPSAKDIGNLRAAVPILEKHYMAIGQPDRADELKRTQIEAEMKHAKSFIDKEELRRASLYTHLVVNKLNNNITPSQKNINDLEAAIVLLEAKGDKWLNFAKSALGDAKKMAQTQKAVPDTGKDLDDKTDKRITANNMHLLSPSVMGVLEERKDTEYIRKILNWFDLTVKEFNDANRSYDNTTRSAGITIYRDQMVSNPFDPSIKAGGDIQYVNKSSDGRFVMMEMGDVQGHGLQAALIACLFDQIAKSFLYPLGDKRMTLMKAIEAVSQDANLNDTQKEEMIKDIIAAYEAYLQIKVAADIVSKYGLKGSFITYNFVLVDNTTRTSYTTQAGGQHVVVITDNTASDPLARIREIMADPALVDNNAKRAAVVKFMGEMLKNQGNLQGAQGFGIAGIKPSAIMEARGKDLLDPEQVDKLVPLIGKVKSGKNDKIKKDNIVISRNVRAVAVAGDGLIEAKYGRTTSQDIHNLGDFEVNGLRPFKSITEYGNMKFAQGVLDYIEGRITWEELINDIMLTRYEKAADGSTNTIPAIAHDDNHGFVIRVGMEGGFTEVPLKPIGVQAGTAAPLEFTPTEPFTTVVKCIDGEVEVRTDNGYGCTLKKGQMARVPGRAAGAIEAGFVEVPLRPIGVQAGTAAPLEFTPTKPFKIVVKCMSGSVEVKTDNGFGCTLTSGQMASVQGVAPSATGLEKGLYQQAIANFEEVYNNTSNEPDLKTLTNTVKDMLDNLMKGDKGKGVEVITNILAALDSSSISRAGKANIEYAVRKVVKMGVGSGVWGNNLNIVAQVALAKEEAPATSEGKRTSRTVSDKYGVSSKSVIIPDDSSKEQIADILKRKVADEMEHSIDPAKARATVFVPIKMQETYNKAMAILLKDQVPGVGKINTVFIDVESPDVATFFILGIKLCEYSRQKDKTRPEDELLNLLALVASGKQDPKDILKKIFDKDFTLKVRQIDFQLIKDRKRALDAVLMSL